MNNLTSDHIGYTVEMEQRMRYYIKSLFHGWRQVSEKRYNQWCQTIRTGAVNMTKERREELIKERARIEKD